MRLPSQTQRPEPKAMSSIEAMRAPFHRDDLRGLDI